MLVLIIARETPCKTIGIVRVFRMQNRQNYQKFVFEWVRESKINQIWVCKAFEAIDFFGYWISPYLDRIDKTIDILRWICRISTQKLPTNLHWIFLFFILFLHIEGTPIGCSEFRKIVLWLVLKSYFSMNLHIHGHNYCYLLLLLPLPHSFQSNPFLQFIFDWLLCTSIWTRALDGLFAVGGECCICYRKVSFDSKSLCQIHDVFVDIILWSMLKIAFYLFNGSFI